MNRALIEKLALELGLDPANLQAQATYGGDINQAYRLTDGEQSWFVKTNEARLLSMFVAERRGLQQLTAANAIRVPRPLDVGVCEGQSYLLLEFVRLDGRPAASALAVALANLHQCCAEQFGNEYDNTIGLTPQINTQEDNWVYFWQQYRLGLQIELAGKRGLDSGMLDRLVSLQSRVGGFFHDYHPRASLLHGDLWSGNWSADSSGQPVIYDPACYFGDHEADLAMMELFGNPGERFFSVYREHFPIDDGYAQRKTLYNLYHIVNHALLFGGGYAAQASRMADQLLASLR